MSATIDLLEQRVNAVADLVHHLRREVTRLQSLLAEPPPSPQQPLPPATVPADEHLLEELSRLREERAFARERIRGLIREIDQVSR